MRTALPVHELFLNYACNAKCAFCYNPAPTPELNRRELSFEAAARSLYQGARAGARLLNLHGGEPTLRDDLPKLLALARKLGFSQVTVVTNGVRLRDRRYARRLHANGATHFRVSLHASGADLHDRIVMIPGAFDAAVRGLAHLAEAGAAVGLNFVLHAANRGELPAFVERFVVRGGSRDVIAYFPHLRGQAADNAAAVALTYADAAPDVRAAFAVLERAGLADALLLANFPPCAVPERADRMLDWAVEGAAAGQTHPEGFTEDIVGMKHGQRRKVAACARCAHGAECLGLEAEYVGRWGADAVVPVEPARC